MKITIEEKDTSMIDKLEEIKKLLRMKTNTKSLEYCVDYVYSKLIK